jgi:hypothetical protein
MKLTNDLHTITLASTPAGEVEVVVRICGIGAHPRSREFSGEPNGTTAVAGRWNTYHVLRRMTPKAVVIHRPDGRVERVELDAEPGVPRWAAYAAAPIVAMLVSGIMRSRRKKARASR